MTSRPSLDARVKLVWSAAVAVAATLLGRPAALAVLLGVTLIPWFVVRAPGRLVTALVTLAALAVGSMAVSQGLFWTGEVRTVWVTLPLGLSLSREGVAYGLGQSLRMITIGSAALSVVACTAPADLLAGLARFGLPPGFCFMVTLALRFLPLMLEHGRRILAVLELRGLVARGPVAAVHRLGWLIPPLMSVLLRQSQQIALAAEARAWDPHRRPPPAAPLRGQDWLALAGVASLLGVVGVAVWHGAGAPPGVIR